MSSNTPINANLQTFAELYGTPVTTTTPAVNTGIQNPPQAVAPNIVNDGAVDNKNTAKGDTITFAGKQISKKKAIIGGAVILAAIAGITTLAIKGKLGSSKIGKEVEALTNEANELTAEAQKTVDNVVAKFNEMIANGKTEDIIEGSLVKITDSADTVNQKIMDEFTEDGKTLLRKSIFDPAKNGKYDLYQIDEFIEGTNKFNHIEMTKGNIGLYLKNTEKIADDIHKADSGVEFLDGYVIYYKDIENLEVLPWGSKINKASQKLDFIHANEETKPYAYCKNFGTNKEKNYELNENGKWEKYKPERSEDIDNDDLDEDIFDDDYYDEYEDE